MRQPLKSLRTVRDDAEEYENVMNMEKLGSKTSLDKTQLNQNKSRLVFSVGQRKSNELEVKNRKYLKLKLHESLYLLGFQTFPALP